MTTFYKILTHDLRPPLQGGDALPLDDLPFTTEAVELDTSKSECGSGYHFVSDLAEGFKIASLWPTGRPARVFEVEPTEDLLERGNKHRASALTFLKEVDLDVIEAGVYDLSKPFGRFRKDMTAEQMAWFAALGRPEHDPERVEAGLQEALKVRSLDWELKRFGAARDAWAARAARAAWAARAARAAWDARDAWASRDAWAARAARDAWASRDARAAWAAWDAWDARDAWAAWDAWAARAARDAWAARDALTVFFASNRGWVKHPSGLLTTGYRDAYHAGLGIAIPTGPNQLGWAMDKDAGREIS